MTTTMNPITRKAEKHNLLGRKEAAPGLGCPVKARCRLSFACPDSGSKNLRFYRSQDLDAGSPLYMDQFIDSCVAVKSGQLTGQFFSDNGREETLTLHGAGRVVQPLGILYSVEPLPWLQAVTDSTICILSREHVLDLVNANIELEREVHRAISEDHAINSLRLWARRGAELKDRIKRYLYLAASSELDAGPEWISLCLTHGFLAQILFTNRESISRALCELEETGLILRGNRCLSIRNPLRERFPQDDANWSPEAKSYCLDLLHFIHR